MKTFIYKTKHSSDKRGYNREITVYRIKNNQPVFVGYDDEISTASYKGDHAIACKIINEKFSAQEAISTVQGKQIEQLLEGMKTLLGQKSDP